MESDAVNSLMQLKGVGPASAQRLVEAGLDDFAKLAAAGEEVLRGIRGLNPRNIPAILAQAGELAGADAASAAAEPAPETPAAGEEEQDPRLVRVRDLIEQLQQEVAGLATAGEKAAKKAKGELLQKEAAKLAKVLTKLEAALPARLKKTGKALTKAEGRLADLSGCGPKKTAGGLKKTRKSLKKVLP